jgi:hypothetical protein
VVIHVAVGVAVVRMNLIIDFMEICVEDELRCLVVGESGHEALIGALPKETVEGKRNEKGLMSDVCIDPKTVDYRNACDLQSGLPAAWIPARLVLGRARVLVKPARTLAGTTT